MRNSIEESAKKRKINKTNTGKFPTIKRIWYPRIQSHAYVYRSVLTVSIENI